MKNIKKHAFNVPHLVGSFYVERNDAGHQMTNDSFKAMAGGVLLASGRDIKSATRKALTRLEKLNQSQFDIALKIEKSK
tara:strand:+ start:242 stop:478 length:237 start_codon:yes stop_codon:yes gene_type:complete